MTEEQTIFLAKEMNRVLGLDPPINLEAPVDEIYDQVREQEMYIVPGKTIWSAEAAFLLEAEFGWVMGEI